MAQVELPPGIEETGTYGISDNWSVTKRLKTAESLIKAVKDRLNENKPYEGDNKGYRNYIRATLSVLSTEMKPKHQPPSTGTRAPTRRRVDEHGNETDEKQ